MTIWRPRRIGAATVLVVALLGGCSGDDATSEIDSTGAKATTATSAAAVDPSVTSETLTGAQICARLRAASVAASLGLDVTTTEADDTGAPQCAYHYVDDTGGTSTLTVAALRPVDVGGATGADALDYVVEINRGTDGDDVEEQQIDAGAGAVRLSGASRHLGVVRIGDRVYTLVVPVGDAEIDAVDHLIGTIATALD